MIIASKYTKWCSWTLHLKPCCQKTTSNLFLLIITKRLAAIFLSSFYIISAGPRTSPRTCFHGHLKDAKNNHNALLTLHFNQFQGNIFIIKITLLKFSVSIVVWNLSSSLCPFFHNIQKFSLIFFSRCKPSS